MHSNATLCVQIDLHTPHEHGQPGEQRVESPVLGKVGDDYGPDRLRGEHGLPGNRHHALLGAHPDRRAQVFQLGVGYVPGSFVQQRFGDTLLQNLL